MAERRPTLVAVVLYALLALVLFAPGLAPGKTLSASDFLWSATPWEASRPDGVPGLGSNRELVDQVVLFQPQLQYTRAALPDVPLWDPHLLGGRPWMGDPQSSVFSVFSLPSYVLPFWKSLAVAAMLKVFLAALGAFLLGRAVGMRTGGALICGLAFGFGLWSVSWVSWTLGSVWTLVPWICLFCELCLRRPGPLPWVGLAAATGIGWLGGHPSSSFQVLVVVTLFFAVRALVAKELRPRLATRLLTLGSGLAAGCALAAVMLIPFAELLAHSGDAGARSDVAKAIFHEEPSRLLGFALHDWWGAGRTSIEFAATTQEHYYYVGALPLMLAVAALVARPRAVRVAVALVGLASILVATGVAPLFDLVVSLPGFEAANNGRFAVIAVMCLAVLAGWGFDELAGAQLAAGRRAAVLVGAVSLFALPAVYALLAGDVNSDVIGRSVRAAWLFAEPDPALLATQQGPQVVRLASLLEWLVPAAAAVALLALRLRGRLSVPAFAGLAVALVALDLLKAGAGYNPAIEQRVAEQPATPAIEYLQARKPERFAGLAGTAAASLSPALPPNTALRYRVFDARGNVIPTEERYVELWRRAISGQPNCYSFFCTVGVTPSRRSFQALGLLGAGYLLQGPRDAPLEGVRPVYAGPDARIYRNPAALPRAFLVERQIVRPDADAQLAAITAAGFPARSAAVTERRLPGLAAAAAGAREPAGSARIAAYADEDVSVRTASSRPALLVLSDNWYPGWKARVDGREAPIHRVNYLLRGVSVPAGSHRVDFAYEPASWRAGWIVSLATLLVLVVVGAVGWRRRERPAERNQAATGTFEA